MIDLSRAFNRRGGARSGPRGARGGGGGASYMRSLENQVRALAYSNLRADTYTVDGVSSKVASFTERSLLSTGIKSITANHAITQATSAQQCAVPAGSSLFRGRMVATFVDQRYSSNSAVSSWTFLHDGTGCTVYNVFTQDSVAGSTYMLTTGFSGTSRGFATGTATTTAVLYIGNGTAAMVNINGGTLATSTATYTRCRYQESVSPEADIYIKTASAANKSLTDAAPSSSDATATLMLGNRVSLVNAPFIGKWAETIIFKGTYSATTDALVRQYLSAYYGVT